LGVNVREREAGDDRAALDVSEQIQLDFASSSAYLEVKP
jgi:hypothetical protein